MPDCERSRFLAVLEGEAVWPPPLWMMRQAGRYLPEYREVRRQAPDFMAFCRNPDLSTEVTLQPIRRFGFDAAIVFSDILVIPPTLGRNVWFVEGEGPRLDPIERAGEVEALPEAADLTLIAPTLETLRRVRAALPPETALIGFCGAPWTVATYMIAGRGTPDQAPARRFAAAEPAAFERLLDTLVAASIAYLLAQLAAGADAVQIFDSWAGVLSEDETDRWVIRPIRRIVEGVRAARPDARIIVFPRAVSPEALARGQAAWSAQGLSLDTSTTFADARGAVGAEVALQGNLDPQVLLAGGEALERALDIMLDGRKGERTIANLGHGIVPPTPIAHVERFVERVRSA